jgi:hypothetical protein
MVKATLPISCLSNIFFLQQRERLWRNHSTANSSRHLPSLESMLTRPSTTLFARSEDTTVRCRATQLAAATALAQTLPSPWTLKARSRRVAAASASSCKKTSALQSGERRAALSCCFMILEATFHGEIERILDAPWHEVRQWHNARRTTLNDRRAQYLSMHRAGSRVLWDAHSDFPFFFSFLFIFSCLVLFRRKYSPLRC